MALGIIEKKRALNGLTANPMLTPDGGTTKFYIGYVNSVTEEVPGGSVNPTTVGRKLYLLYLGRQKDTNLSTEVAAVTNDQHIVDILNPDKTTDLVPINTGNVKQPVSGEITFDVLFESGNNVTLANRNISTQVVIPAGWSVGIAALVYDVTNVTSDAPSDAQRRDLVVAWFKLAQSGTQYVYPVQGTLAISAATASSGGWKITLQEG